MTVQPSQGHEPGATPPEELDRLIGAAAEAARELVGSRPSVSRSSSAVRSSRSLSSSVSCSASRASRGMSSTTSAPHHNATAVPIHYGPSTRPGSSSPSTADQLEYPAQVNAKVRARLQLSDDGDYSACWT